MPNYNTQLQSNNIDLQAILNAINELPEAGSGGEQATPIISVNSTNGLITATAGTKSSTYQMAFQPAKTITPSTTSQVAISSGHYAGGNITVAAVPTQTKTVTPKSTAQDITPDSGKFLSKVTVNGDSNLVARNIKNGVSIFGVSGTLEEGSGSGEPVEWSENEDAMITGTLSSYFNDRVKSIGAYAFYVYRGLTSVNFPACTTIKQNAFYYCSSLTSINFPACTFIGDRAFYSCTSLTSVNFPACTTIDAQAFYNCENLTLISFPACTTIGQSAFYYCSRLTSINFPACTTIGGQAFYYCSRLTSINFPACTNIGNYTFCSCTELTSVNLPVCTNISSNAFRDCYRLSSLTLSAPTRCTLQNSNAFFSTPYAGYKSYFLGTPYIYVPASLIDAYKSATNWVYFSSYFSTIESLET